jgi:hypothetical protein
MSVLRAERFIAYGLRLQMVALIGKSGRKTANVCDKRAKETTRNTVTDFTGFAFIILLRKTGRKVPQDVPKGASEPSVPIAATQFSRQFMTDCSAGLLASHCPLTCGGAWNEFPNANPDDFNDRGVAHATIP